MFNHANYGSCNTTLSATNAATTALFGSRLRTPITRTSPAWASWRSGSRSRRVLVAGCWFLTSRQPVTSLQLQINHGRLIQQHVNQHAGDRNVEPDRERPPRDAPMLGVARLQARATA